MGQYLYLWQFPAQISFILLYQGEFMHKHLIKLN